VEVVGLAMFLSVDTENKNIIKVNKNERTGLVNRVIELLECFGCIFWTEWPELEL
jgi:hypothetical protein